MDGPQTDPGGVDDDVRRGIVYVILGGAALLVVSLVLVTTLFIVSIVGTGEEDATASRERAAQLAKLPPYWTVRRGDTFVKIAQETGLTVEELESFNPYVDPSAIQPGQRVQLREEVPKPKPKPRGPKWVTVRTGDSFGSIAAKTGKNINRLQQLNPKLKPKTLQPGDRMRLR